MAGEETARLVCTITLFLFFMIDDLTQILSEQSSAIDEWITQKAADVPIPFYASADIRDSGLKTVCVDLNIFPAGFNNICNNLALRAIAPIRSYLKEYFNDKPFDRVVIVPEAHTRNRYYNSHLARLQALLQAADLKIDIAALPHENAPPAESLITAEDEEIARTYVQRKDNLIVDPHGTPYDWVLLNNDLSSGPLDILTDIAQPVLPPACLGWHKRRKSIYYACFEKCVHELAEKFSFDPWLLSPYTSVVKNVDFSTEAGREAVATEVEALQERIQKKYTEYTSDETPTVFIKNDAGTYGMGIMVVEDSDEIRTMNRKARNKMAIGKGKTPITDVVLQEGVRTRTVAKGNVSEEVIYLVGKNVVGAFLRANTQRDDIDNLNARGMEFYQYCALNPVTTHGECMCTRESQFVYYLLAQLGVVAAAYETTRMCPNMEDKT